MKKTSVLTLACAGATFALTPAAASAAPSPAAPATQSLAFQYLSSQAKDDPSYGKVVEVEFTVTNTGTSHGPWEFHALAADGKNFLDDEGEEMYTGCDSAMSQLDPGRSTTCRTVFRLSKAEIAAGVSQPENIHFQWGSTGPSFPGFTVPAVTFAAPGAPGAPATPGEPTSSVDTKSLAFTYKNAVAKNDASYGPVVEVTFGVENTGNTPGPWEFHVLTADGKNFLDDEGEEMYTGCDSAMSQLDPGEKTTCRTVMRLSREELAKGVSSAQEVGFKWGASGPSFPGFTVPGLNLAHLKSVVPSEPVAPSPTPEAPAPASDGGQPSDDGPSGSAEPTGTDPGAGSVEGERPVAAVKPAAGGSEKPGGAGLPAVASPVAVKKPDAVSSSAPSRGDLAGVTQGSAAGGVGGASTQVGTTLGGATAGGARSSQRGGAAAEASGAGPLVQTDHVKSQASPGVGELALGAVAGATLLVRRVARKRR